MQTVTADIHRLPPASIRSWEGTRPTMPDVPYWFTDGATMFPPNALSTSKGLLLRRHTSTDIRAPLRRAAAHRVWDDALGAVGPHCTLDIIETPADRPADLDSSTEFVPKATFRDTSSSVSHPCITVDSRKLALAIAYTRATAFRFHDDRHPLVGYTDDLPSFILMPLRPDRNTRTSR